MGHSFQVMRADCSPYDRIAPARERFYWSSAVAGDIAGPVGNARTARLDRASRGFARGIPAHAKPLRQDGLLHLRLHLHLRRREGRGQARDHAPRRSVRSPPAREVPRNSRIRVRSGMSAARTHPRTREDARRRDARGRDPARALEASRANAIESRASRAGRAPRDRDAGASASERPPRGSTAEKDARRSCVDSNPLERAPLPHPLPRPLSLALSLTLFPSHSSPLQRGRRQG